MNAVEETIFWLVPDPEHALRFQAVVDALAAAQGAPSFRPHITLGAVRGAQADIAGVLEGLPPLTLSPVEVDATERFTMSLFVRFERTDALMSARTAMEELPGFRAGRAFDPHISLCYGASPNRVKMAADIRALLRAPVRFDRMIAMRIPLPVDSYDDIRKWNEVGSFEFGR